MPGAETADSPLPKDLTQAVLDSLTAHIAVVDEHGRIVAVNRAWRRFAQGNGDPPEHAIGVGANYLTVCRLASAGGDGTAVQALTGILDVLRGRREHFSMEYPCHGPGDYRWFLMNVGALAGRRAVVLAHEDITTRKRAEDALNRSRLQLEQEVRVRTAELEGLNAALREEMAERLQFEAQLRQAAKVFASSSEAILVTDPDSRIVTVNEAFTAITGYGRGEVLGKTPRVLRSGRHDQGFYEAMWRSLDATDQWQGEVWNRRKSGEVYPAWVTINAVRDAQGRVTNYVAVSSDISSIKETESHLHQLAHHDPLTGLANRLLFSARLEHAVAHARRQEQRVALLFMDLDQFKAVNDRFGHGAGDELLQAMAGRLGGLVRGEDTVARLGGDEFTVIAEALSTTGDAAVLAEKVIAALVEPVTVEGTAICCGTSIGISLFPDDADTPQGLIRAADTAMYRAKERGGRTYAFYGEAPKGLAHGAKGSA